VFKPNGTVYFSDPDFDAILNAQDLDSDNDGLDNLNDPDIDNDGILNTEVMTNQVDRMLGSLYDYTNGNILDIPVRVGFVNATKLVDRAYANTGIFFGTQMATDYHANPTGYMYTPTDYRFAGNVDNWKIWLAHTNRLLPAEQLQQAQPFDILFFESGHVALWYPQHNQATVIEADDSHLYTGIVPLATVITREGEVIAVGQVLAPNSTTNTVLR
jgi:hypothetical protein